MDSPSSSVFSSIAILLTAGCPFAILGGIVSVVIYPFQCQIWRRLGPHILDEVFKGFPSVAKSYATTSIILKPYVFRVEASGFHAYPSSIFTSFIHSMFSEGFFSNFIIEAFATPYVAIVKVLYKCLDYVSAVTFANPIVPIRRFMGKFMDGKPSVPFPSEVLFFRHKSIITSDLLMSTTEGWF